MVYQSKRNFQNHPFHLVSPSPWPLFTSKSLFILTASIVCFMHGFQYFENLVPIAIINVAYVMGLWFRDIISEGKISFNVILENLYVKIASAIGKEIIEKVKLNISKSLLKDKNNQFGYYLAGLFEGDGHISLPFLSDTTLNRVFNPRIVFTSHENNLELFVYIQTMLKEKGRFQKSGGNTIRFIIGDIEGIKIFIDTIHNKLRTPNKNESFNILIDFINKKYNLAIPFSKLDESDFSRNSWLTGLTEADGHFGVKIVEAKPKSDTRKRSVSYNISLKFRLDQQYLEKLNEGSNLNIMEKLAKFLDCKLSIYNNKTGKVLSLNVLSLEKIGFVINYFNEYPLLGTKCKDFKDWEIVYNMMISKKHLTDEERLKIKLIQSNMNSKRKIDLKYEL